MTLVVHNQRYYDDAQKMISIRLTDWLTELMNAIQLSEQVEDNVYKMIVQEKRQTLQQYSILCHRILP